MAVACALEDGGGYLLVHGPTKDVEARAAPFVGVFLAVGCVTLFFTVALLSIVMHLILVRHHETLDREHARSTSDLLRHTQLLIRTRDAVIFALAKLAGYRDDETGSHLERISAYSSVLASAARLHPKFSRQISSTFVRIIEFSSVLHDIGKVGIEDSILRKPGQLTHAERQRMQQHAVMAGDCLEDIAEHLGSTNFLDMAREIAVAHHERWDGSGYPNGLRGDAIPLSARIVAIADVYDALATRRVYKNILPHEQCVAVIREGAGTQFDPDLVEVWLTVGASFREIAARYADVATDTGPSRFHPAPWGPEPDRQNKTPVCPGEPAGTDAEAPADSPALL
jgi:putative two-component system response regulator